jgi:hypothetical protein
MIVYHATRNRETLTAIVTNGFIDVGGTYLTDQWWEGVWLSDRPLSTGEGGLSGDEPLLRLDIPENALAEHEWVNEPFMGYREWLVPAAIVNGYGPPVHVGDALEG